MRHDLLKGERLFGVDVEQKDGALFCPILICLRRVEEEEEISGFRVAVPVEYVGNKLPTALTDVRLKILGRVDRGQVSED